MARQPVLQYVGEYNTGAVYCMLHLSQLECVVAGSNNATLLVLTPAVCLDLTLCLSFFFFLRWFMALFALVP
jgi:hypothetical protein